MWGAGIHKICQTVFWFHINTTLSYYLNDWKGTNNGALASIGSQIRQINTTQARVVLQVAHKPHSHRTVLDMGSQTSLLTGHLPPSVLPSRLLLLSRLGSGPFQLALLSLIEVRLKPASVPRERDVHIPVGLGDRVHPLLQTFAVPSGRRWRLPGVSGLVYALPIGQSDLVLVFRTNYAQLAIKFLWEKQVHNRRWVKRRSLRPVNICIILY